MSEMGFGDTQENVQGKQICKCDIQGSSLQKVIFYRIINKSY